MTLNDLRHAVSDGPAGTATAVAPPAHDAAARLKAAHRTFWCTTQADGCGGILDLHVGKVRIPHFQHRRDASACTLSGRDAAASYAHLAYQRELASWLASQGYVASMEHRFNDAGRADLHVVVDGVAHTLEVQLTDIGVHAWQDRDARYRAHVDQVTWLHGPSSTTAATTDRVGRDYALRIRRDNDIVQLGVDTTGTETGTAWAALSECRLTPAGVWTPHLEPALRALADARAEAAARRRAQGEEEERVRRTAETERRAALERGQERTPAPYEAEFAKRRLPGSAGPGVVHNVPPPGLRRTADWRRLQPNLPLWEHDHPGWAWLRQYPIEHHEAGMYLANTVVRLYARGAYSMLANPDLPTEVTRAMVENMASAGWLREDTRGALEPMWVRGEQAPGA